MKNSKIIRFLVPLFSFLVTNTVFSQDTGTGTGTGFGDGVDDTGNNTNVPIDDYLIIAALLILLYVFYKMKKIGAVKSFSNENSSSCLI